MRFSFKKASIVFFVVGVLVTLFSASLYGQKELPSDFSKPGDYLIVNEISLNPGGAEAPWIELFNPFANEVKGSGLILEINDRFRFAIPELLPPVPAGGFVVIRLDGKGEKTKKFKFKNKSLVLHAPTELLKAIEPRPGHIAIYRQLDKSDRKIVSFVAWGAPASKESLTAERNRIWSYNRFVNPYQNFGLYGLGTMIPKGAVIGLYPGSMTTAVENWVAYSSLEATLGAPNAVPSPAAFTLADGAVVRSEDVAIGWTASKQVKLFYFQMAKDPGFSMLMADQKLEIPLYKPKEILPEGTYYYRVKVIDRNGRESRWSTVMRVVSKKMVGRSGGRERVLGAAEVLLSMNLEYQRKDTLLLCLDGCASEEDASTIKHWDNGHPEMTPNYGDHGDMNCVRASLSMIVSYYGGKHLSQDRIAYYTEEESPTAGDTIPEWDLAHSTGMGASEVEPAVEWALDESVDYYTTMPIFSQIQTWLDSGCPNITATWGHARAMNGYRIDDDGNEWVHLLDPWSGERWEAFSTWSSGSHYLWVCPASAPNAREDEPSIALDSDGDGVMDFDEQIRFLTGRFDADSDNDGVADKNDIREYVFNAANSYAKRNADTDSDGVRKEKDPDNEGDGYNDGCEDKNFNGKFEPALGETDNFAANAGLSCTGKPIHAMVVFDRSGSMVYPPSDPVKKYDQAASAAILFLDTWLANDPPTDTKVGLVFYDCSAYFDTGAATNTTLETLSAVKRDKINAAFAINRPNYGATSIGGGLMKSMDINGFNVDSIPAADQDRVVIVLTDGMENCGTRMNDPVLTDRLAANKVDGYVLGIGDESEIDAGLLNNLADILNHSPASLAKDMSEFEVEKFFLQVLAETQGLEFSSDPAEEILLNQVREHMVTVSAGTSKVTFAVVWNTPNAVMDVVLKNTAGTLVAADAFKANTYYQVLTKNVPLPGTWTVEVRARHTGAGTAPDKVRYNLMVLEKNPGIRSHFQVSGLYYQVGQPLLLMANLAREKMPWLHSEIAVEVSKPAIGWKKFVETAPLKPLKKIIGPVEKGVVPTPLRSKYLQMVHQGLRVPTSKMVVRLNDDGRDGDLIRGDGIYSAYFNETALDGIYSFRFITRIRQPGKTETVIATREKLINIRLASPDKVE